MRRNSCGWLVRASALGLVLVTWLAGCSSLQKSIDRINHAASATGSLETSIQETLSSKFHRSVRSVSCSPYVDQVLQEDMARFTCVVRFTDGTSYTTPGTVTDPSNDPDTIWYNYSFNDPPGIDITTAPLPGPTVALAAGSSASLFNAQNLTAVVKRLTARFGTQDLILQAAVYPGEVEAVIGANGKAWLVSVTYSGDLKVGAPTSFSGSRNGIAFSQLIPSAIQHMTQLIVAKGAVPLSRIDRFVLVNSLPGGNAGWNITLTSGSTRFQSLVLGDHLVMITPSGTRALN
ncbi:MAG TPA: hypothetical protein VGS19_21735 [Streptosporangiaceae bacterium]|nr:hypothetical protein [Streptosporangiaceae bacterium]